MAIVAERPVGDDEVGAGPDRGDPVARAVRVALLVYLSPVLLVVFLVGGLGLALCAIVDAVTGGGHRDRRGPAVGRPKAAHLAVAAGEVRSARR